MNSPKGKQETSLRLRRGRLAFIKCGSRNSTSAATSSA
jgi:hypothetical protein